MGRLDDLDLTLKLSRQEEEERLEAAQKRLLALRLRLGGLIGDGHRPAGVRAVRGLGRAAARAARSSASSPRSTRATCASRSSPRPTHDEKRHHFLLALRPGAARAGAGWPCSTAPGTGACWSSASRGSRPSEQWQRAYDEINEFERTLADEGMILVKFWLHISDEEQLKRFEARRDDPLKSWKLTDEDWRNREKRSAYEAAVEDMLERTDTAAAPWHLVEGESKRYARVKVVETVCGVEAGMRRGRPAAACA